MNTPESRAITGDDTCESRASTGRFVPGVSGNPGGRPKDEHRIAELARSHGPAALERLVQLKDSKDERVALSACVALLDRGYGKPAQAIAVSGHEDAPRITQIRLVALEPLEAEGGAHG